GKLLARAAGDAARAEAAEAERGRVSGELADSKARVEEMGTASQALRVTIARLEEEAESSAALHGAGLQRMESVLAEQLKAVEQRERDLRTRFAEIDTKVSETFKGLAADALKSSSAEFLKLAKESLAVEQERVKGEMEKGKIAVDALVKPIAET